MSPDPAPNRHWDQVPAGMVYIVSDIVECLTLQTLLLRVHSSWVEIPVAAHDLGPVDAA